MTEREDAKIAAENAIDAAKDAATAVEVSRIAQAALTQSESDKRVIGLISESLRQVFGENQNAGRFVDVSRIPLICQNINIIHENMKEMKEIISEKLVSKEQFSLVQKIVYGLVSLIVTGFIGALLAMIYQKQ